MRSLQRATLLLATASLSCDLLVTECTLIGCADGVTVLVSDAPASGATVTLRVPGANPVVLTCASTSACATIGVTLMNQTPATLTVEVASERGQRSVTVTPSYRESRPNGEDCEPVCVNATVSVVA